jgi:hypothetical protein
VTSSLPRKCSTTELQQREQFSRAAWRGRGGVLRVSCARIPRRRAAALGRLRANARRSRGGWSGRVERVMGIEPTRSAWKADVLPLNYTRPGGCPRGTEGLGRSRARSESCPGHPSIGARIEDRKPSPARVNRAGSTGRADRPTGSRLVEPAARLEPSGDPDRPWTGGRSRIRTCEGSASRFTVCPRWPLGYPPDACSRPWRSVRVRASRTRSRHIQTSCSVERERSARRAAAPSGAGRARRSTRRRSRLREVFRAHRPRCGAGGLF